MVRSCVVYVNSCRLGQRSDGRHGSSLLVCILTMFTHPLTTTAITCVHIVSILLDTSAVWEHRLFRYTLTDVPSCLLASNKIIFLNLGSPSLWKTTSNTTPCYKMCLHKITIILNYYTVTTVY